MKGVEVDIDVTKSERTFSCCDWGDDHRIIIEDIQVSMTEKQLKSLASEIVDYLDSVHDVPDIEVLKDNQYDGEETRL